MKCKEIINAKKNLTIHLTQIICFFWNPGRFAFLPEMTGLRKSDNFTLYSSEMDNQETEYQISSSTGSYQ